MPIDEIDDSLDDALELLADPYRRGIMYTLKEEDEERFDYDELVDEMIDKGYIGEDVRQKFEGSVTGIQHYPEDS